MTIYLDHMASTPLAPEVLAAMLPWMDPAAAGNPHAAHGPGWRAREAVEAARAQVAALVGARPGEVVFTSGATEANALALLGVEPPGARVAASAVEHASVLSCLPVLAARGVHTELLPVDGAGRVLPGALEEFLAAGPALVSVAAAGGETGTVQPLDAVGALCGERGALLHCDAAQALSTLGIDMHGSGIALLTLSGHKLYGPMGIGALVVRDGLRVVPPAPGGGQQEGRRPGTLPTPLCVGLGEACRLALARREADAGRLRTLRERLWAALAAAVPGIRRNTPPDGLAGCLHVTLPGLDAADLLLDLPDLALATGSACHAGDGRPSPALTAMGMRPEEAHGSLRFGLGRGTSEAEIDRAAALLADAVRIRRSGKP